MSSVTVSSVSPEVISQFQEMLISGKRKYEKAVAELRNAKPLSPTAAAAINAAIKEFDIRVDENSKALSKNVTRLSLARIHEVTEMWNDFIGRALNDIKLELDEINSMKTVEIEALEKKDESSEKEVAPVLQEASQPPQTNLVVIEKLVTNSNLPDPDKEYNEYLVSHIKDDEL